MAIGTTTALILGGAMVASSVGSALLTDTSAPKVSIPAATPSGARTDTGAQVKLGTSETQDQRVSGSRSTSSSTKSVDILSGLGKGGGLNI